MFFSRYELAIYFFLFIRNSILTKCSEYKGISINNPMSLLIDTLGASLE